MACFSFAPLSRALLTFAVGFHEIVATTLSSVPDVQTLTLWIFAHLLLGLASVVNMVAAVLTVAAIVPMWIAQRRSGDSLSSHV